MKPRISSEWPHDPRYFRFDRTCSGFAPPRRANWGDRAVFAVALIVLVLIATGTLR